MRKYYNKLLINPSPEEYYNILPHKLYEKKTHGDIIIPDKHFYSTYNSLKPIIEPEENNFIRSSTQNRVGSVAALATLDPSYVRIAILTDVKTATKIAVDEGRGLPVWNQRLNIFLEGHIAYAERKIDQLGHITNRQLSAIFTDPLCPDSAASQLDTLGRQVQAGFDEMEARWTGSTES